MTNYYLKNGTRESGPYVLDDLKYQRITSNTLVKIEDGQWTPIGQVKDLRFLLNEEYAGGNSYSSAKSEHKQDSSSSTHTPNSDPNTIKPKSTIIVAIAIAILGFVLAAVGFIFATSSN